MQQELELPVPHRTALLGLLAQEIEDLPGVSNRTARWERILRDGIRRWLRSPRDVVRLSNAVKFSWAAIEGEIDPQDVIAMEGLRLFDPEAFDWARENRPLIFGEGRHFWRDAGTQEPVIDRLRATVPNRVRAEVLELLGLLFPSVEKPLTSAQKDGDRAVPFAIGAWPIEDHVDCAKRRGVGSEAGYDTYFGTASVSGCDPTRRGRPFGRRDGGGEDQGVPGALSARQEEQVRQAADRGSPRGTVRTLPRPGRGGAGACNAGGAFRGGRRHPRRRRGRCGFAVVVDRRDAGPLGG